jgi:1-deoxy-D-xylulose-5-phosphate reductoisomerase
MKILLLGSTGSIGTSACRCIRRFAHQFSLVGLSTNRNVDSLFSQAAEFGIKALCITGEQQVNPADYRRMPTGCRLFTGADGLIEMVETLDYDVLLNAIVGSAGLPPTLVALKRNKRVALANKESLVVGGECIDALLANGHGSLVPVDSEHSAILQCLNGEARGSVESLILTASGGPFRETPKTGFDAITPARALAHPTWSMGHKISIDSATLINKGFEVIEAHHLFSIPYERLRICIHPQSIIHSMVVFHDGAVIAQLGLPDMELPIQYALSYPHRLPFPGRRLDLPDIGTLTFQKPDLDRFPCLKLCLQAGAQGGAAPVALNAANEVAVRLFLDGAIGFNAIAVIIEETLSRDACGHAGTLEAILTIDRAARAHAAEIAQRMKQ